MNDVDTLARTLYGEAKARDSAEALAIASVVMNRVKAARWPDDVAFVCQQPFQFSCWNKNDPNLPRILAANATDDWFKGCLGIARKVIAGQAADPTNGATHYYAKSMKKAPPWRTDKATKKLKAPCFESSSHLFFNDIDTKPPQTAKEALDQARPLTSTRTVKGAQTAVIGGGVLASLAPLADHVGTAAGVVTSLAQYAPWVLAGALFLGLGYVVWTRIDDRNKGVH